VVLERHKQEPHILIAKSAAFQPLARLELELRVTAEHDMEVAFTDSLHEEQVVALFEHLEEEKFTIAGHLSLELELILLDLEVYQNRDFGPVSRLRAADRQHT
jgi:hypothetical protein